MPWKDPMLARMQKDGRLGIVENGVRKESVGFYATDVLLGRAGGKKEPVIMTFHGPPCRTLDDMSQDEIEKIEHEYGCRIVSERFQFHD